MSKTIEDEFSDYLLTPKERTARDKEAREKEAQGKVEEIVARLRTIETEHPKMSAKLEAIERAYKAWLAERPNAGYGRDVPVPSILQDFNSRTEVEATIQRLRGDVRGLEAEYSMRQGELAVASGERDMVFGGANVDKLVAEIEANKYVLPGRDTNIRVGIVEPSTQAIVDKVVKDDGANAGGGA